MAERRIGNRAALGIIVVITGLLLTVRATSDFWMDELLTLSLFVQQPALSNVFNNYPIANNHVLFSAVAWCWVKALAGLPLGSELLMRVPSVLATLGAVVVVAVGGRQYLGNGRAALAALILGVSPAVQSVGWQVRGYGLTLLLVCWASVAFLQAAKAGRLTGRVALALLPPLLLLPVVVPSNLIFGGGLAIAMGICWWRQGRPQHGISLLLAVAVAAVAGMAVYLPVREQFLQVVRQTSGWDSGLAVGAQFILASMLLLLPAGLLLAGKRQLGGRQRAVADPGPIWVLAGVSIVLALAFALVKAPFPRTLVMFLPPVVLAVATVLPAFPPEKLLKPILLVVVVGAIESLVIMRLNDADRANGVRRQNLVTQFYTGSRMWSDACARSDATGLPESQPIVIAPFHDVLTVQWYWPDPEGAQLINTPSSTGAYAFRPPRSALAERPFLILQPAGEDLVAACRELAGAPIRTAEIGESGPIRFIQAQARGSADDFSVERP